MSNNQLPMAARATHGGAAKMRDPEQTLVFALDIIEGLAMGNDPKDLHQIAKTARIAMREYREQKAAADAQKAAQVQADSKAVAKLSERLADAYVLIQDASACIRATTHWSDLEALQRKLSDAVKAYRSTPSKVRKRHRRPRPVAVRACDGCQNYTGNATLTS